MSYVYLNLHVTDMEDRTQYSFAEYSTEAIREQIKEAEAEHKRINALRRIEMATYEDDERYDEVENWKQQASAEISRRNEEAAAVAEEDDRWPEQDYALHSGNPKEPCDEAAYMKPMSPDLVQKACDALEKRARDAGTPPSLEEYYKMNRNEQMYWTCLVCCGPALAGSIIPGSYCSVSCGYLKYAY